MNGIPPVHSTILAEAACRRHCHHRRTAGGFRYDRSAARRNGSRIGRGGNVVITTADEEGGL